MQKPHVMQSNSHKSAISIIFAALESYRKSKQWSRETMVQEIVDAHYKAGFNVSSEVEFDPETKDTYKRMKVNADRIYRWLDESTDKNLLSANLTNSILMALPIDLRIATANQLHMQIGLSCNGLNSTAIHNTPLDILQKIMRESAEAQQSIAALIDGETEAELHTAHKEISEAIAQLTLAKEMVETKIVEQRKENIGGNQ